MNYKDLSGITNEKFCEPGSPKPIDPFEPNRVDKLLSAGKGAAGASALDINNTTEALTNMLVQREGWVNSAYADSRGYGTIGIGHLLTPGDPRSLSDQQVVALFKEDLQERWSRVENLVKNELGMDNHCLFLAIFSAEFQCCVSGPWHKVWGSVWEHLKAGRFSDAIMKIKSATSGWPVQTPVRAADMVNILKGMIGQTINGKTITMFFKDIHLQGMEFIKHAFAKEEPEAAWCAGPDSSQGCA
jgi:GH24 family phage-related lysozyme (muramidase)